jgi:hypothetical protein
VVTGIFFILLTLSFFLFAHYFLKRKQSNLSDPLFSLSYNSLYMNLEVSKAHSILMTSFFLARRFFLGLFLSFCDNHQSAQFFYMNLTSAGLLIYLVKVRPMVSSYLNNIEIFNELVLYICTGMIAGMTDYQPDRKIEMTDKQYMESYNDKQS